jgi:hypothetical protein
MTSAKKTTLVSFGAIFLLISAAIGLFKYAELKLVEVHQKGVSKSIAAWGDEYSQIRSEADAIRAVEMMEYISRYYVTPNPGYKGPRASERKLEEQRARTLSKLASSVETFTGQRFGTNIQAWIRWNEQKQRGQPSEPSTNKPQTTM